MQWVLHSRAWRGENGAESNEEKARATVSGHTALHKVYINLNYLDAASCLGNHKAVMVLSGKFLRFLGSLDRSKSKGREWFSGLPTQSQIRNPPWSPICNFPT